MITTELSNANCQMHQHETQMIWEQLESVCVSVWEERCRYVNVLAARARRRRWGKHTHTHTHTQSVLWLRVCLSVRITMCICESSSSGRGSFYFITAELTTHTHIDNTDLRRALEWFMIWYAEINLMHLKHYGFEYVCGCSVCCLNKMYQQRIHSPARAIMTSYAAEFMHVVSPRSARATHVMIVTGLFEMSKFCAESITGDQREMHAG